MKYEIINPSDQCFIETDDDRVAAACVLFLGNGKYGCKNTETGKTLGGVMFLFGGDIEKVWKETYDIGFDEFLSDAENRKKIADCYASFSYKGEPTSLNDIGEKAKLLEQGVREGLRDKITPSP